MGDVYIEGPEAPTLTLENGAIIRFSEGANLYIGQSEAGTLLADAAVLTSDQEVGSPGDWGVVYIGAYEDGSYLTGTVIEFGEGVEIDSAAPTLELCTISAMLGDGLTLLGTAAPSITESTFSSNIGRGLLAEDLSVTLPTFTANTLTGNAEPAAVHAGLLEVMPGSSFTGNDLDEITVQGGTLDGDALWSTPGVPYYVSLTIEQTAGTLQMTENLDFRMNPGVSAQFQNSDGVTIEGPVTFTSAQDVPAAGDWGHLSLSNADVDGLRVLYGGDSGSLHVYGDSVLTDVTIADGSAHALRAYSGTLAITDSQILENAGDGMDIGDLSAFSGNNISGNGGVPLLLPASSVRYLDTSSTFTGNGTDHIRIGYGAVSDTATWINVGVDYVAGDDIVVSSAGILTLADEVSIQFEAGTGIFVGDPTTGALIAEGDIVLTSSALSPAPGDWLGVYFGPSCGPSVLEGVTVEYGGGNGYGNVWTAMCDDLTIENSTIAYSSNYGIYRILSSIVPNDITYVDNASGDLY